MPKKDKDVSIAMFLTELKDQKLLGITWNPSILEEDFKLKLSLEYIVHSGPAWATIGRPYITDKKKKEERGFFFKSTFR